MGLFDPPLLHGACEALLKYTLQRRKINITNLNIISDYFPTKFLLNSDNVCAGLPQCDILFDNLASIHLDNSVVALVIIYLRHLVYAS